MSVRQPSVNLIAEAHPCAIDYLETNFPAVDNGSAEISWEAQLMSKSFIGVGHKQRLFGWLDA